MHLAFGAIEVICYLQPTLSQSTHFVSNDIEYIFSASNVFPDRSPRSVRPLPRLNYFVPLIPAVSLSPRPMCVIVAGLIVSHVISSVPKVSSSWKYSRVVGERCLQVLGQPLEIVPKLLELAVGHRHDVHKGERGTKQGSVPRAAVTAWRRAAHNPPENDTG